MTMNYIVMNMIVKLHDHHELHGHHENEHHELEHHKRVNGHGLLEIVNLLHEKARMLDLPVFSQVWYRTERINDAGTGPKEAIHSGILWSGSRLS
jgi:hypothetical protein